MVGRWASVIPDHEGPVQVFEYERRRGIPITCGGLPAGRHISAAIPEKGTDWILRCVRYSQQQWFLHVPVRNILKLLLITQKLPNGLAKPDVVKQSSAAEARFPD